jgi:hypothetical protein
VELSLDNIKKITAISAATPVSSIERLPCPHLAPYFFAYSTLAIFAWHTISVSSYKCSTRWASQMSSSGVIL